MITVIAIPADDSHHVRVEQLAPPYGGHYRRLVGGDVQVLDLHDPDASLYMNEEGKLEGQPMNPRATALLWVANPVFRHRDVIVGDAFVVGPVGADGEDRTVPEEYVQLLTRAARAQVEARRVDEQGWHQLDPLYEDVFLAHAHAAGLAQFRGDVAEVRVVEAPADANGPFSRELGHLIMVFDLLPAGEPTSALSGHSHG